MSRQSPNKALAERGVAAPAGYDSVLSEVVRLLEDSRRASARAVNAVMTATYWEVGRRIVEGEQAGGKRAAYGKELLKRLSADLTPSSVVASLRGTSSRCDCSISGGGFRRHCLRNLSWRR